MAQSESRNDHVDKIKEAIANTEHNMIQADEVLASVAMSDEKRDHLQEKNARRVQSMDEFKHALEDDFPQ